VKKNSNLDFKFPKRVIHELSASSSLEQLNTLYNSIKLNHKTDNDSKDLAIFLAAPSFLDLIITNGVNNECLTLKGSKFKSDLNNSFRFHLTFEHLQQQFNLFLCRFEAMSGDDDFKLNKKEIKCLETNCAKLDWSQRFKLSFSLNFYQIY
jgi:hypothetical protein